MISDIFAKKLCVICFADIIALMRPIPLNIEAVGKSYLKKKNAPRVISDINFDVKEGEIFGLIGLNGVGKTTLIKIILDLITATEGRAEIFGVNATDHNARKKLAYLPEKFVPSQFLKGYEFLNLVTGAYDKKLDKDKAIEGAIKLGLDPEALNKLVRKYSKGMGQKLGLLGAFLTEAPLLILDEPMSGLDPRARVMLKDYLVEYRNSGRTIFFSSHILSDIDEICNRIAVIHSGAMPFIGTPEQMKKEFKEESLERAFLKCIDSMAEAA
jgi:ABC-2 type transport system ATP-binding protein